MSELKRFEEASEIPIEMFGRVPGKARMTMELICHHLESNGPINWNPRHGIGHDKGEITDFKTQT